MQGKRDKEADMNQARLRAHSGMAQMDALAVIGQWWRARCDVSSSVVTLTLSLALALALGLPPTRCDVSNFRAVK